MEIPHLVALDLDGTLINPDATIAAKTLQQLARLHKHQVIIAIATGRPAEDTLRFMEGNGIGGSTGYPEFLICEERDIYELKDGQYQPWCPWNQEALTTERDLLPRAREIIQEFSRQYPHLTFRLNDEATQERRGFVEAVFPDPETALAAHTKLLDLMGADNLRPVRNHRGIALRFPILGKGPILAKLSEHLGIPPELVLAMGDSQNDMGMLQRFLPATTGNADQEVKELVEARGGIIAQRERSEGVGDVLEMIVTRLEEIA